MSKPKPLPEIKACPSGCRRVEVWKFGGSDLFQVRSCHGWNGPARSSPRAAILAWNRRSDADAERRRVDEIVTDTAKWLVRVGYPVSAERLMNAHDRGEVTGKPAAPEPLIVSKPGVQGGKPCVRGTRIMVATLQAASEGWDNEEILRQYPSLIPEGLAAALAYKLPGKRGQR